MPRDLVLFGATGFTGAQAAHWLDAHVGTSLDWAVAGRSRAKLDALLSTLQTPVPAVVADGTDAAACRALAESTRAVLSMAGPFRRYSDHLAGACAASGTHYADITGETPWVRTLIDRFGAEAERTGARLTPCCGFDSIPSDASVLALRDLAETLGTTLVKVRSLYTVAGGLNGGTLASFLDIRERGSHRVLAKPYLLCTQRGPSRFGPPRAYFDAEFGKWSVPFVMSGGNSQIVLRSHELRGDPPLDYLERKGIRSRAKAYAYTASLGFGFAAMGSRTVRRLVKRLGPAPGEGPSDERRARGYYRNDVRAWTADGRKLTGRFTSPGDPGNTATVFMACVSALCLARGDGLPDRAGVLTPATAIGPLLLDELRAGGAEIDVAAG